MPGKLLKQRQLLPIGFALVIILLLLIAGIGIIRMQHNNQIMEEVVTQNNDKLNIVSTLYITARERSVLLLKMLTLDDPFERDELYLKFNELATVFAVNRQTLATKKLDEYEVRLLQRQAEVTKQNVVWQIEVADMIAEDRLEEASELLLEKAIPGQDKILVSLKDFLEYEREAARTSFESANKMAMDTGRFMGVITGIAVLLSLFIAVHVIRTINRERQRLEESHQNLEQKVQERTQALSDSYDKLNQQKHEIEDKNQALLTLSNKLSKYLSPQVYSSIFEGRQDVKLSSQRKKLTIMFVDIVNFTETTDRMAPEDLTNVLNQFFSEMTAIALEDGATIDKYIGDEVMLFYGDPESRGIKEDALAGISTAIRMQQRLTELQEQWYEIGLSTPLQCRISIHTGYCTVGNFGSEHRMDYTIMGGAVNLASRMQHHANAEEILISNDTYNLVKNQVTCNPKGSFDIRGMAYPIDIYQIEY